MSTPSTPDLTQRPPRSPRLRLGGYVQLPRIIDKARASLAGKLGEYRFNGRGMDRHFFNFVGLTHEAQQNEVAKGGGDGALLDGVMVDGSAAFVARSAQVVRRLQTGYLYSYAFAMIVGLVLLLGGFWYWGLR